MTVTVYPRYRDSALRTKEVAAMLSDAFGAGVARAELSAGTSHAAHAAVSAAARKHRAAAATDASVGVGGPPKAT
ncbi:hypothetical protein ACDT10_23230 [Mycobacterium intracellulare]